MKLFRNNIKNTIKEYNKDKFVLSPKKYYKKIFNERRDNDNKLLNFSIKFISIFLKRKK